MQKSAARSLLIAPNLVNPGREDSGAESEHVNFSRRFANVDTPLEYILETNGLRSPLPN